MISKPEVRVCRRCGRAKPIKQFHLDARCKSGRRRTCRVCVNAITKEWRANWTKEQRDCFHSKLREYKHEPNCKRIRSKYKMEYYRRHRFGKKNAYAKWSCQDSRYVVEHKIRDVELSEVLGRSVGAIQVHRSKMGEMVVKR